MVSMKGVAFALGGVGLVLFLSGVVWAFVAEPPCKTDACPGWDSNKILTNIMFLWIGGIVLEFVAVLFLFLHFRDLRRPPTAQKPGPIRATPSKTMPAGPNVSITRRDGPRQG